RFYLNQKQSIKAYETLFDILKPGLKSVEEHGFYLFAKAFSLLTDVCVAETDRPGVSWMVKELEEVFPRIADVIDGLDGYKEIVGNDLFDQFRRDWNRFEPASHFNAKIYLRYQFYSIKVMRL